MRIHNQSGFSLITVMIVSLILTLIAVGTSSILTQKSKDTHHLRDSMRKDAIVDYIDDSLDCCKTLEFTDPGLTTKFSTSGTGTVSCSDVLADLRPAGQPHEGSGDPKDSIPPKNIRDEIIAEQQTSFDPTATYRDNGYYIGKTNFSIHCTSTNLNPTPTDTDTELKLHIYTWKGQPTKTFKDPLTNRDLTIPVMKQEICPGFLTVGGSPIPYGC